MDCFVFPGRKWSLQSKRIGYRRLSQDADNSVTVVVGEEKRVFVVDPLVLEKEPFRVLLEMMRNKKKGFNEEDGEGVIFIDIDAILFEHLLWLMYNDCSSFLELNLREIIEFYAQDSWK